MEQAVWLAFGVIAVILGFSIIANLMTQNKEDMRYNKFVESIDALKNQCDFVCDSPLDTYLSTDVEMPSGMRLYTQKDRICANLNISSTYNDETKCELCKCPVNGSLNLQTEAARKSFTLHKYSCYFERRQNDIQMECKG